MSYFTEITSKTALITAKAQTANGSTLGQKVMARKAYKTRKTMSKVIIIVVFARHLTPICHQISKTSVNVCIYYK